MSTNNENKLVPRLRFKEFIKGEEWSKDKVDNIFELQDGYPFSSFDFTEVRENSVQIVRITDINNQNKNAEKVYLSHSKIGELEIEKYKIQQGDLLLSLTGAAGFNFFIWNSADAYINQRTMKMSPKHYENEALVILLDPLIYSKINAIGTGQNNNLSKDALKDIEFVFPSPNEQKKIAACLSSLDEVITAEREKLELYKTHKKGLLQNLFPLSESGFARLEDERMSEAGSKKILKSKNPENQDSDKVPKLRFKEFEDSGAWKKKKFEELFEIGNGRDYKHLNHGNIPVFGSGGYMLSVDDCLYDGESVCIGRKGTIDKPMFITGKFWTVDTLFYTHSFKGNLPKYIYYVFQNIDWRKHNEAGGVPSLSKTNIYKIETLIPSFKEQQKIAACLSSLDNLITAQTQKVETLELHKKGLLQGLFPAVNDLNT